MSRLWFKRKRYGWGWTPVNTQGWIITALFVIVIILNARDLAQAMPHSLGLLSFIVKTIIATGLFLIICYKRGEKPKWQWGSSDKGKK